MTIKNCYLMTPPYQFEIETSINFIPQNSQKHLIEVDMGNGRFMKYQQVQLYLYLPDNIFYQRLIPISGQDFTEEKYEDVIVITGEIENQDLILFKSVIENDANLPQDILESIKTIKLPIFPEQEITSLIIRGNTKHNQFYLFNCLDALYRPKKHALLYLRYMQAYNMPGNILSGWFDTEFTSLHNVPLY